MTVPSRNGIPYHQQPMRHQTRENQGAILLNKFENETLFRLFGSRCLSLASGVVQVFQTSAESGHNRWNKLTAGVVTMIRDSEKRSYFLRVFDINRKEKIFEQELYTQFEYRPLTATFHAFEGDNCLYALNFANENEAQYFREAVETKIQERKAKKMRKRQSVAPPNPHLSVNGGMTLSGGGGGGGSTGLIRAYSPSSPSMGKKGGKKQQKKVKKKVLSKSDIGEPTGFVHLAHVGWDADTGFDLNGLDPSMREFFVKAGVSDTELKDESTRRFIYGFIQEHGGLEAVMREAREDQTPPTPPPVPPPPSHPPPPPPPNRRDPPSSRPSAAVQQGKKPPPPPRQSPRPPPTQKNGPPPTPPPPPPPISSIPPPPPMPPAFAPLPPPPPASLPFASPPSSAPSGASSLPPMQHDRINLLESIRSGVQLKHVDSAAPSRPTEVRDALLKQIQGGINLKRVDPSEHPRPAPGGAGDGIAEKLRKALEERAPKFQIQDSSSSDTDDEEHDDDEWDD